MMDPRATQQERNFAERNQGYQSTYASMKELAGSAALGNNRKDNTHAFNAMA